MKFMFLFKRFFWCIFYRFTLLYCIAENLIQFVVHMKIYQRCPRSRLIIYSGLSTQASAKLVWACCQKRRKKPCIQSLRFPWKRLRGRLPNRWKDLIRKDVDLPLLTVERIAKDRDWWKKCVKKKCARIWIDYAFKWKYILW